MNILVVDDNIKRRRAISSIIREQWRHKVYFKEDEIDFHASIDLLNKILNELRGGKIFYNSKYKRPLEFLANIPDKTKDEIDFILIEDVNSRNDLNENYYKRLPFPLEPNHKQVFEILSKLFAPPPRPPKVIISEDNQTRLYHLINSLGDNGIEVINELIFQIFPYSDTFYLSWMDQGFSDSRLFHISETINGENSKVVKLFPLIKSDKCIEELKNYPHPTDNRDGRLIPIIYWNKSGAGTPEGKPGIAEFKGWTALAYEDMGVNQDPICDLAKSYLNVEDNCFGDIGEDDPAISVLKSLFRSLKAEWYNDGHFENKALWKNIINTNSKIIKTYPPYGLKLSEKCKVSENIDNIGKYGEIICDTWHEDMAQVKESIWEGISISDTYLTDGTVPVLLTQVHGDLNGGNIKYNILKDKPYLIDLAWYKKSNHNLQDFARLEVEFKFTFMDSTNPQNRDLSPDLLKSWIKLDNILCAKLLDNKLDYKNTGISRCAERTANIIKYIRSEALLLHNNIEEIKHQGFCEQHFTPAYLIALLFETLQTLSYTSLPIVKRVFAVTSAANIIRILEQTASVCIPSEQSGPLASQS